MLLAFPASSFAQDDEELDTFVTVGSRIKQIDQVTVAPVVTISRDEMDDTGYNTVGDAIRSLSFNNGQTLTDDSGSSTFGYGASTVNFRGIGNNNVLMLINGRRAAPFGSPAYDGYQTVFDLDSLPASAIESIEILKDGGSAIYGSDAVSGVINIKLRRDFEGVTTNFRIGDYTGASAPERSASVVVGTSSEKTSVVVTVDYSKSDAIYARELDWQGKTADLRSYLNRAKIQEWQDWAYGPGELDDDYFYNGYGDTRSTYPYPARVTVPGDGEGFEGGNYTFAEPTATPTVDGAVEYDGDEYGRYDYAKDYGYLPSKEIMGFYASVRHDFTDYLYGFVELAYRQSKIYSESAPAPMTSTDHGDGALGQLVIPASNPYNPWGVEIDSFRYRAVEAGNRITDASIETPRILFGLGGKIAGDWEWEAGYLTTKSTVNSNNWNVFDDRLQAAFNGVVLADYDTDIARTMYLNPFGPSDPEVNDYISGWNPNSNYSKIDTFDFNASGSLFELPAGNLQLAVGGEYREEDYAETVTDSNRSGNLVGGSWYDSSNGMRDVKSLYGELSIPVIDMIDLQIAVRFEDYSDFGQTTKPKYAIKIRPIDSVIFRASYGQSFLAPNLAYLYTSEKVTFTSRNYLDPIRISDPGKQIEQHGGGNPDLVPEETETVFLSLAWEPAGVLEGFFAEIQYFYMSSENLIDEIDAAEMLNGIDSATAYTASGNIVRLAPEAGEEYGQILYVNSYYQNRGTRKYSGYDFSIGYNLQTDSLGEFNIKLTGTYLEELTIDGTDYTDWETNPDLTGTLLLGWSNADWAANLFFRYTDSREGELGSSDEPKVNGFNVYESQITTNVTVAYAGFEGHRITMGVTNLFDEDPPLSLWGSYGTSAGTVATKPRFVYLSLESNF